MNGRSAAERNAGSVVKVDALFLCFDEIDLERLHRFLTPPNEHEKLN